MPTGVMKTKVVITALIILSCGILTVSLSGLGSNATQYQAEGLVIEFEHYNTVWTDASFREYETVSELTDYACSNQGYTFTKDASGKITSIDGKTDSSESTWSLWVADNDASSLSKSSDYNLRCEGHKVIVWAYCPEGSEPTLALDATGTSIYGYAQAQRTVTLSPVCTEIVSAMNALSTIVGTDSFSDYPDTIVTEKKNGHIATVGTYVSPSYEAIMHTSPDMVFCDGSQYDHRAMAEILRNSNVNAVVLKNGTDIETIYDNIFIVGTAMGYNLRAIQIIDDLHAAMAIIESKVSGSTALKVMCSLSSDAAPWIAGNNTYISDIISTVNMVNTYQFIDGWTPITPEMIGIYDDSTYDSDIIFVMTDTEAYSATEASYNELIHYLPENWKKTTAYQNGDIYLFCESFGEMAQRSATRFAQLTEIIARITSPDAFTDGVTVPKYIGDDYRDYLKITDHLGFEG